jgi:hypothetical protein
MATVSSLDQSRLRAACFEVARTTLWSRRPTDVLAIQSLADTFFARAVEYEEFVSGQERDPNLITRAVEYLGHTHAIPPMRDDASWFGDMLAVLIELACPNCGAESSAEDFYQDIEFGISVSRSDYRRSAP